MNASKIHTQRFYILYVHSSRIINLHLTHGYHIFAHTPHA